MMPGSFSLPRAILQQPVVFMERRAATVVAASFVVAISIESLLVLVYGALGIKGNSLFSATLLALPSMLFICEALYSRYRPRLDPVDLVFCCFLSAVAVSFLTNEPNAKTKDVALLILCSVVAYPSARVVRYCHIDKIRLYCFWLSAGILTVGTSATLYDLVFFPNVERPIVFGFDHTVTVLSLSLAFFAISSIFQIQRWKSATGFFALLLIAVSTSTFAASQIRFSLVATTAAFLLALFFKPREFTCACILVFAVSAAAGLFARSDLTSVMLSYMTELPKQKADITPSEEPKFHGSINIDPRYQTIPPDLSSQQEAMPSCKLRVNLRNSVVIREALYLDALALAPTVGFFGYGLDSFSKMGCLSGYEVHNLFVQAIVEFGWFGGISFFLLLAIPFWRLLPLARKKPDIAFMTTLYAFLILIDMAYGGINRELPLFVCVGAMVGILAARANCQPART
jgi:hypothetical protein